ncbi:aldehyde dehydrogenase [Sphingomonas montanisoli]|uniref:Aldehyde dehydrogenase n=1 Tax=Sphingomonas montanisoli TaxID=2606412 RepID=A0A5D9C7Y7_9SPHN|nr:aldehyde dehydrogenase [Sphingomonas montanisoli]TZG27884.1 aldehyde dehydrogenase [Sphingomonas montanisoli]
MTAPNVRHPDRFFIDGEWVAPSSDRTLTVISAHTGEAFATFAEAQAPDVERAVAAARDAFDNGPWARLTHKERAGYLLAMAAEFEKRGDELADAQSNEMGIVRTMAGWAGVGASGTLKEYAAMAETYPFVEKHAPRGGGTGYVVYEAVGVVGAIIPWNSPTSLTMIKVAPALLAGCTMIVKMSPEAPHAGWVLAEICEKVGLPKGVINVIVADREVSELIVRHPQVDKISFTGSSVAGKKIASICGERIARCTLELGGKSAAVLLDDYDVGAAAQNLAGSLMFMNGQVCAALTRVIVPRARQHAFAEAVAATFKHIKVGDPFDQATKLGPLATERQRDRVEGYIAKGRAEGATLVGGGERPSELQRGWFVSPTVFADVDPNATIAQEEIFGPVLSVIPSDSEEQAIAIANNSAFGLNSAVFTNDVDAAYRVGRQLRAGTVGHNGFKIDMSLGFGGYKQSGIGREGGHQGLRAFLESKTMLMAGDVAELA